jgi:hypothetical protein
VATLRGAEIVTLRGAACTTLGDVGLGGWGIGLARYNGDELMNGITTFQLGSGCSWDCTF